MVDLGALAGSCPAVGPGWTHQSDDLNVNLLIFAAGDGVAEHSNDEVDVLIVGIQGRGSIQVYGPGVCRRAGTGDGHPEGGTARHAERATGSPTLPVTAAAGALAHGAVSSVP